MKTFFKNRAFTLVEVILGLTILTIFMGASITLYISAKQGASINTDYSYASFLLKEGINGVRAIRDTNFLSLQNGVHGLSRGASSYQLTASPDVSNTVFTRTVTIESLYRDVSGNLAATGTEDSSIKKVKVQIDFPGVGGVLRSVSSTTYLSDWASAEIVHTLLPDFGSLTKTNIAAVSMPFPPVNNGGLKLDTTYSENGFYSSADLHNHANDLVANGNYVFIANEKDNKGLIVVDISNPNSLQVVAEKDIEGKGKSIDRSGNTLAIGVDKDVKGLAYVNVANPLAPAILSTINIGEKAIKVLMSGTLTFATTNKNDGELVIINSANPATPSILKKVDMSKDGVGLAIYGNYLYVGVKDSGVNVYNISNPSSPTLIQQFPVGNGHPNAMVVDFPYIYMAAESAAKDIYVARMNDQGILTLVTSLTLESKKHARDLALSGDDLIVGTDDNNKGIVVIDVNNPEAPVALEYKDVNSKIRGVAIVGEYIGAATETNNEGFILIGAGSRGFFNSGTYTSGAIDVGTANPEYLSLGFVATVPPGGTVSIKLRTADSANGLNSAAWSVPYTVSPALLSLPSKRFIQYQISMTGDGNTSPALDVLNIEFLP